MVLVCMNVFVDAPIFARALFILLKRRRAKK